MREKREKGRKVDPFDLFRIHPKTDSLAF